MKKEHKAYHMHNVIEFKELYNKLRYFSMCMICYLWLCMCMYMSDILPRPSHSNQQVDCTV